MIITFTYTGPEPNCITLKKTGEVILCKGKTYKLDNSNSHVKGLIAKGYLTAQAIPEPPGEKDEKSKNQPKKS